jgi:hypothetical protein
MDASLQKWVMTLPESWDYKLVSIVQDMPCEPELAPAWPGPQHSYQDIFVSSIINDYRVSRIFCHTVILACNRFLGRADSQGLDPQVDLDLLNARFVTQQLVDDICASVPYNMQYSNRVAQQGNDVTGTYQLMIEMLQPCRG